MQPVGIQILATNEGDEGKEPSSLELRVQAVVCLERCSLWECKSWRQGRRIIRQRAKSHHIVGAACRSGGGCREMQPVGMQVLATRVTKAKSHHIVGAACGSGGGCRKMHFGNANLGDEGDEGKEPASLEPRVACESGGGCREMQPVGIQVLATRVTKAKSHHIVTVPPLQFGLQRWGVRLHLFLAGSRGVLSVFFGC
jgi:hypothetical protein